MIIRNYRKVILGGIIIAQAFACFSEDQEEKKMKLEFVEAVSIAANIASPGGYDKNSVYSRRSNISNLETLLSAEIISYSWDYPVGIVPLRDSIHLKNADELEKIRLMVDCYLQEMILVERLKDLHAKRLEAEKIIVKKAKVCADIEDFFDRLSHARRIEMRGNLNRETYIYTVDMNKEKIKKLSDMFSNVELEYDPMECDLRYETSPLEADPLPSSRRIFYAAYFSSISLKITID